MKWIYHSQSIDLQTMLQVFTVQDGATTLLRGPDNQSVPERNHPQAMQVHGGQNVRHIYFHYCEASEYLQLGPRYLRRNPKLASCRHEILLENLYRYDATPVFAASLTSGLRRIKSVSL